MKKDGNAVVAEEGTDMKTETDDGTAGETAPKNGIEKEKEELEKEVKIE